MGGYLIFRATSWGPWAFSDSSAYLSASRNIQSGNGAVIHNSNGTFTPVTEFPPFFPVIINIFTPIKGDFVATTRWINILCFFLSTFMIGLLCYQTSGNLLAVFFSTALFAFSPVMVDTFSGFMSEPIFISLLLFLVFYIYKFIKTQNKLFFFLTIVASAMLPLIRYAGLLFIFCLSFSLLFFGKKTIRESLPTFFLYLVAALTPISIWFINQFTNLNKVGGKSFLFKIEIIKDFFGSIEQEFQVLLSWIPYSGTYSNRILNNAFLIFFIGLFLTSVVHGIIAIREKNLKRSDDSLFLFILSLFLVIAYVIFIGFTHNLTIPKIDIIDRMMAPIYPFIILILILGLLSNAYLGKSRVIGITLLLVAIFSTRFYLLSSLGYVRELYSNGKGYTSRQFMQSDFLHQLVKLPSDQQMISNSAAFVLFHTNRFPYPVEQFPNHSFGSGNSYGEKPFRQKKAALILIFPEFRNYYGSNSDQLLNTLTAGLQVDFQDEIGGIYYYPEDSIPQ